MGMWDGYPACTGLQVTCRKGEPQSGGRELRKRHHTHILAHSGTASCGTAGTHLVAKCLNEHHHHPPPPPPGNHSLRCLPPPPPMGRPPARVRWPMMCTCPARGAPCASEKSKDTNKVTTQSWHSHNKQTAKAREGRGTTNLQSWGVKESE